MKTYDDGANVQAQIILALLKNYEIEESWDSEYRRYRAEMKVERWHNCREQGYSVAMRPKVWRGNQDVTLAWAEHRSSDSIVVYEYKGAPMNPLTVHDMATQPEAGAANTSHTVSGRKRPTISRIGFAKCIFQSR